MSAPEDVAPVRGKGLRAGVLGRRETTGLALASTAPAYSIAATLGILVGATGASAPWVLALAVLPVAAVASCFAELNRAEPDCGTVFAWVRRGMGPRAGWTAGWASVAACVLVLSNLAQVAAVYALRLVGADGAADSRLAQGALGLVFLSVLAAVAVRGVELAARLQTALVLFELAALLVLVVGAMAQADGAPLALTVPREGGLGTALVAAVFLYWGWDTAFSVNEESTEPRRVPALAAGVANAVLVVVYVLVAFAALRYAGADRLAGSGDDVLAVLAEELFGSTGGRLLVAAVLVSALASTQTTILPTARTLLSMAVRDQVPARLARTSRWGTPALATWAMTAVSALVYVGLLAASGDVLGDSVEATGILIALYYAMTAAAVPLVFRGRLAARPVRRVVLPAAAALAFTVVLLDALRTASAVSLVAAGLALAAGAAVLVSVRPHVGPAAPDTVAVDLSA